MSNHLAIATVSAVLRNTLQKALDAAFPTIPGARATTTRPNAPAADLPHPGQGALELEELWRGFSVCMGVGAPCIRWPRDPSRDRG